MPFARAPRLDENNSALYVSRTDRVKTCYLNPNPAQYRLSWGNQRFDGPHVVMVAELPGSRKDGHGLTPMEVYGCELEAFRATHLPANGDGHSWCKVSRVRAAWVDEPTEIVTVVNGQVESLAVVPAGHWIVQNPGGEQYYNSPEVFAQTYMVDSDAV